MFVQGFGLHWKKRWNMNLERRKNLERRRKLGIKNRRNIFGGSKEE